MKAGLSQRQLASRIGRTQAFIWKIESGTQHVDIATLLDLAETFDVPASSIIALVEQRRQG